MTSTTPDPMTDFPGIATDQTNVRERDERWDDAAVIDQVLRLVAEHHAATSAALGRPTPAPRPAELRRSPLGRDLRLLAAADRDAAPAAVHEAATRVLDLLLRPLALDERPVPAWFWQTGIGQLVTRAERAVRAPGELLTSAQAASRLGADWATVEAWLADGLLPAVADEDGRPLVPCDVVERRRLVALELAGERSVLGDIVLAERPLAS